MESERGLESKGKCGREPLLWFPLEGPGEARGAGLGLATWSNFNFRGLWDMGESRLSSTWPWGDQGKGTMALSVRAS